MSYDLMVFDPEAAPKDASAFMAWFEQQTQWSEGHGYDDPKVCSSKLRAWSAEMLEMFPAMNGPLADPTEDSPRVTDYSFGHAVIYAAFGWSQAENAYAKMLELAEKHGVGFFDVSSETGAVWLPGAGGTYARSFDAAR